MLIAFLLTVGLWITPGIIALAHGVENRCSAGLTCACRRRWLRCLAHPAVCSADGLAARAVYTILAHTANIDWGTILLFGGGLALGEMMFSTAWQVDGRGHRARAPGDTVLGLTMLFRGSHDHDQNEAPGAWLSPWPAVSQAAGVRRSSRRWRHVCAHARVCSCVQDPNTIAMARNRPPVNDPRTVLDVVGWASGGGSDDDSAESAMRIARSSASQSG